jgi:plasmid stability protein
MTELTVRQIEPEIVANLRLRAQQHGRTVEDEHRAILRDALLNGGSGTTASSFEQHLRAMPNVGEDADFSRIEGSMRPVDLSE